MNIALDLHEELHEETLQLALGAETREGAASPSVGPAKAVTLAHIEIPGKVDDVPVKKEPSGNGRSALELDARELQFPTAVEALTKGLLEALAQSDERWDKGVQELVSTFTGKLPNG
jgi:hypothetical protein